MSCASPSAYLIYLSRWIAFLGEAEVPGGAGIARYMLLCQI